MGGKLLKGKGGFAVHWMGRPLTDKIGMTIVLSTLRKRREGWGTGRHKGVIRPTGPLLRKMASPKVPKGREYTYQNECATSPHWH